MLLAYVNHSCREFERLTAIFRLFPTLGMPGSVLFFRESPANIVYVSGLKDRNVHGSAFKELTDKSYFRLVRPAHHGIMWPHEQDLSADTIVWVILNIF